MVAVSMAKLRAMKTLAVVLLASILFLACGPKSYSDTAIGKRKWKYYNQTQYGLHPKKGPNP